MKVTLWIGRRMFVLGRIFDAHAPFGFRQSRAWKVDLASFNVGRWGLLVGSFR